MILLAPEPARDVVLMVRFGGALKIAYETAPASTTAVSTDTYAITNPRTFEAYLAAVLSGEHRDVTVVVTVLAVAELALLLKHLYLLTPDPHDKYKQNYLDAYNHHTSQLQQLHHRDSHDVPLELGQYDIPLPFKLVFVVPAKCADDISLQQYVRFIAMKHGAAVAVTDSTDTILDQVKLQTPPKPIYDPQEQLHLYIPQAWDSWNKILLLSKAVLYRDDVLLIADLDKLAALNIAYNAYFYDNNGGFLDLVPQTSSTATTAPLPADNKPESLLPPTATFLELLKHVVS